MAAPAFLPRLGVASSRPPLELLAGQAVAVLRRRGIAPLPGGSTGPAGWVDGVVETAMGRLPRTTNGFFGGIGSRFAHPDAMAGIRTGNEGRARVANPGVAAKGFEPA